MSAARRVLGIDPGTRTTGWGVIDRDERGGLHLVACGSIRSPARRPLPDRLLDIHDAVAVVIADHEPHTLSIETAYSGPNVQSALRLGECRAVCMLAGRRAGLEVAEYPPARIKKAVTGSGNARKGRVRDLVGSALGRDLSEVAFDLDTSDALATALCHLYATDGPLSAAILVGERKKRRSGRARFTAADLAKRGMLPEG